MQTASRHRQISVDDIVLPCSVAPVKQFNRCFVYAGKAYDEDMVLIPSDVLQSSVKDLHGYDGYVAPKLPTLSNEPVDYSWDDLTFFIQDTFLDCNDSYKNRMWFHLGYVDNITWCLDRTIFKDGEVDIKFMFQHHVTTKEKLNGLVKLYKSFHWQGMLCIDENKPYGDNQISYIRF